MYELTNILKDFTELLKKEENCETKNHLITTITDVVTKNYNQIQNEGYFINKEKEDQKYKEYVSNKLTNIETEIKELETQFDNDRSDSKFAMLSGDESENSSENDKNHENDDRLIKFNYLMEEASELKSQLHALEYPVYKRDQEYHESIESRLNRMEISTNSNYSNICINNNKFVNFEKTTNQDISELRGSERDLYSNINEIRDSERDLYNKYDILKKTQDLIYDNDVKIGDNASNLEYLRDKFQRMCEYIDDNEIKVRETNDKFELMCVELEGKLCNQSKHFSETTDQLDLMCVDLEGRVCEQSKYFSNLIQTKVADINSRLDNQTAFVPVKNSGAYTENTDIIKPVPLLRTGLKETVPLLRTGLKETLPKFDITKIYPPPPPPPNSVVNEEDEYVKSDKAVKEGDAWFIEFKNTKSEINHDETGETIVLKRPLQDKKDAFERMDIYNVHPQVTEPKTYAPNMNSPRPEQMSRSLNSSPISFLPDIVPPAVLMSEFGCPYTPTTSNDYIPISEDEQW